MSGVGPGAGAGYLVWGVVVPCPALGQLGHPRPGEGEAVAGLLEPFPAGTARFQEGDGLVQRHQVVVQTRKPRRDHRAPDVSVGQPVHVTATRGPAFLDDQPVIDEVADGAGDRRRGDLQRRGQLRGGAGVAVGGQQVGEHPGRHAWDAGVLQGPAEPLDRFTDIRHRPRLTSLRSPGHESSAEAAR